VICGNAFAAPPTPDVNVVNTPDVNVVNTVDTNVVNTVDTNVVNTISAANLRGVDFAGALPAGGTIIVSSVEPFKLRSISTGIAPDVLGERCIASVSVIVEGSDESIGFSVMSNGQASNITRNYEIPFGPITSLMWDILGNASLCHISLSLSGEIDSQSETAQALGADHPMRIETR
jgi:hypothetical protein